MTITYIFHSGFLIESESCNIVFDFWKDPQNVVDKALKSEKPLYVLSSHFHEDHFNKEIFSWKYVRQDIKYILSKDILKHRRAEKADADAWIAKGAVYEDDIIKVTATGSTDSGISEVVNVDGHTVFHAGDLNNWHPDMEKQYLGELKDIRKVADRFDIAMFPIDSRTRPDYTIGLGQFLQRFKVGLVVPMHFSTNGFASLDNVDAENFWKIGKDGESKEW